MLTQDKILYWFFLIVFCFLMLSPFGSNMVLVFGGNYYPEFFVVFLLVVINIFFPSIYSYVIGCFNQYSVIAWAAWCIFLVVLGGALLHGNYIAAYADARSFLVFILAFVYFSRVSPSDPMSRDVLLFHVVCISLVAHFIFFSFFAGSGDDDSIKLGYPFAMFFCLLYAMRNNVKLRYVLIFVVIVVYAAVTSFYRQNWIMASILVFASVLSCLTLNKKPSLIFLKLLLLLGIIFIMMPIVQSIVFDYFSSSESRYIHSIKKFENLMDLLKYGEAGEGDDIRAAYIEFFISNIYAFLLPSGFGHKAMYYLTSLWTDQKLPVAGASVDGGYIFGFVHLGVITVLLGMIYIISCVITRISEESMFGCKVIYLAILLSCAVIFVTNGQVFTVITAAFFYGAALGSIVKKSNKNYNFVNKRRI
ncbi:hypothetical protein NT239_14930 [Chitinibacter sp. SCUT-21]|uniref:hypothetical protein n=1 Tax=Chitinibacter sp. SCUT-21 TaxID=2970891 RepID=UPI0035A574DF